MPADENYFGLGDKAGRMNRRNRSFTMWNTDEFGWQESSDPLYKTIPFFMGFRNGAAYGVFFDNTYRSSFDFGKESADYFSFGAVGGELNYYFFSGPNAEEDYRELYRAGGTRSVASTLEFRVPAKPLQLLSGSASARDCSDLQAKENPAGRNLFRYRLPARICAVHGKPPIFSNV